MASRIDVDTSRSDVDDPVQFNQSAIGYHPSAFPGISPFKTHPTNMWTFMVSYFIYAFAYGYKFKLQISIEPNTTYQELCFKVSLISRSLAYTALISVLVSPSLEPVVFIICFLFLFTYFAQDKIVCTCKDVVSYAYNKWKQITGSNDNQQPATSVAP